MRTVKAFLSYSWDSSDLRGQVHAFAEELRRRGIEANADLYHTDPDEGMPAWMERQIKTNDFVLSVCTDSYRRKFEDEVQPSAGLGVKTEAQLIRQAIHESGHKQKKFRAILLPGAQRPQHVPTILHPWWQYSIPEEFDELVAHLTGKEIYEKTPVATSVKRIIPRSAPPLVGGGAQNTHVGGVGNTRQDQQRLRVKIANAATAAEISPEPYICFLVQPRKPSDLSNHFRMMSSPLMNLLVHPPRLRDQGADLTVKNPVHRLGQLVENVNAFRIYQRGQRLAELWRDATIIFVDSKSSFITEETKERPELTTMAVTEMSYLFVELAKQLYAACEDPPLRLHFWLQVSGLDLNQHRRVSLSPKETGASGDGLETRPAPDTEVDIELFATTEDRSERTAYLLLADLYAWFGFHASEMPYTKEEQGERIIDIEKIRSQ